MAQEAHEWVSATRRSNGMSTGGIHVYIDAENLKYALKKAEIPINAQLKLRRYPLTHKKV